MVTILAKGEFPQSSELREALTSAEYLICCDGAINQCLAYNIIPNIIIGDIDSLSEDIMELYYDRIVRVEEQETNDLTKAVNYALSLGSKEILILGATGLREDHTIANLSLLMDYSKKVTVRMESDYGVFFPCFDKCELNVAKGSEISIFNFGAHNFNAKGLVYPLYDFTKLWQGTLNVAKDTSIQITANGSFLVYVSKETPR